MEQKYFKQVITAVLLVVLLILSFILLRPILLSIIAGMILAFIFTPLYNKFYNATKSKNISAFLMCILPVVLILVPFFFLIPVIIEQSIKIYSASQQMDFITPLEKIFPYFSSQDASSQIVGALQSIVTKMISSLTNSLSQVLLNSPNLFLQLVVTFFVFFFVMRDGEKLLVYLRGLIPFSKDLEKKVFENTKGITNSVIYGQIIVGIIQGIIVGIGLFIFGVPNALLLSFIAILVSVLPVIGPFLVWVPVAIYLLIAGSMGSSVGVTIFGIIASTVDNFLRPFIVAKRTKINSGLVLIGMIGGLYVFGVLGLILGPLILAYLIIILEIYKDKRIPTILIKE